MDNTWKTTPKVFLRDFLPSFIFVLLTLAKLGQAIHPSSRFQLLLDGSHNNILGVKGMKVNLCTKIMHSGQHLWKSNLDVRVFFIPQKKCQSAHAHAIPRKKVRSNSNRKSQICDRTFYRRSKALIAIYCCHTDEQFCNFKASKSVDRRTLCSSRTSCDGF